MQFINRGDRELVVLEEPVAFFTPEHVHDPSRHPSGAIVGGGDSSEEGCLDRPMTEYAPKKGSQAP